MTLKAYIWGMRFLTLLFLLAFGLVLFYIDPENWGNIGKLIFYLTLFLLLTGLFNLFLLFFRRKIISDDETLEKINFSFRQAVLLALLATSLLMLQSFRMLVWWDGLLVVAGIFLIELYFLSKK